MATSAKCAEGSGSTPPRSALFLLGQLSSLMDVTARLFPLSLTPNQKVEAPAAAEREFSIVDLVFPDGVRYRAPYDANKKLTSSFVSDLLPSE